jgi:hypothetical protein
MNEPRAREDCASRQKHLRGVKHKLFMKIIGGPKIGLLFPSREPLTSDVDCAVEQILRALKKVGLEARRETLRLKLRRYCDEGPFADGIFSAGEGTCGVLLYGPKELNCPQIEQFLIQNLDVVPFFLTYKDGNSERLFSEPVLPEFPELPTPVTVLWTANGGVVTAPMASELTLK